MVWRHDPAQLSEKGFIDACKLMKSQIPHLFGWHSEFQAFLVQDSGFLIHLFPTTAIFVLKVLS